jgi:peptidoglycan hydrolase-like protein with peptidoglycan-binding domain
MALTVLLLSGCQLTEGMSRNFGSGADPSVPETSSEAVQVQPEPAVNQVKASQATVLSTQRMLLDLGYEPGTPDGLEGPRTAAAVRRYQGDHNMPVDGRVSPGLKHHLEKTLGRTQTAKTDSKNKVEASKDKTKGTDTTRYSLDAVLYEPGDTFVYSNGLVETVERIDGDKIFWRSNRAEQFTALRNFILPSVAWTSNSESGEATFSGASDVLWPLSVGKEASFAVTSVNKGTQQANSPSELVRRWLCAVEGREIVKVPAGSFKTLKVTCNTSGTAPEERTRRTWYYSPKIGHYVRLEEAFGGQNSGTSIELVAIRPGTLDWPPAARAGLDRALSHALENLPKGEDVMWESSSADFTISITPISRLGEDEKYCRIFVQTRSGPAGKRIYPGLACREPSGKWQIPGLDPTKVAKN